MRKDIHLDKLEQDIEDNFESLHRVPRMKNEITVLQNAAKLHAKRKRAITIRIHEMDLEAIRLKASKLGVPYQTYINMLIHKDAINRI